MHAAKPARPDEALRLLDEAWTGFRSLDVPDRPNLAKVSLWRGRKLAEPGQPAKALEHLEKALALMTELERDFDRAQVLEALGEVQIELGNDTATQYFAQAAQLYEDGGHLLAGA
jgi:tetratricopeptide (TPR) repeat protein